MEMKHLLIAVLALPLFTFSTCNKEKDLLSPCIQEKIEAIKAQPRWNPPAQVDEYLYNGKKVYLFSSDCCDQYNILYDAECNYICAPSGGLTGKGDGKCTDFKETAQHLRVVWKDPR